MVELAHQPAGVSEWDPTVPGQLVRLRDNPGKKGITTGRTKKATGLMVERVRP